MTTVLRALPVLMSALWLMLAALPVSLASAAGSGAEATASQTESASGLPIKSAQKALYILVDPESDRQSASLVTIATAAEFNKRLASDAKGDTVGWAVPQPDWKLTDFSKQCRDDTNTIGAVVISYYSGDATHFWLLWQSQTTTFELVAEIVTCNQTAPVHGAEIVKVISALHGAHDSPWVERRSDTSVPLLSGVAIVALLGHTATKSAPTNVLTLATLGTAVLGQSFNKDIPGYSAPVRYRFNAHHVGNDVVTEMRWLCGDPTIPGAVVPDGDLGAFCALFKWQPPPS